MSNGYFQFKQFRIEQDRCAMKVSTDACIHGAWTPISANTRNVLDIGCGTGLLSLMLAQKDPQLRVEALELDEQAVLQARENIAASPSREQIRVIHTDARLFQTDKKYDLIICNPPFFSNSLLGETAQRNQARHTLTLSQEDLFDTLSRHLGASGICSVLLPVTEHVLWAKLLAANDWHIHHTLSVHPRNDKAINRIVSLSAPYPIASGTDQALAIYESEGGYSSAFTALMQPYYLNL